MRITEAAQRLGTSPRMLRYRETLGLLPAVGHSPGHRQFGDQDVAAVALALELERRLDISPAALAFGLRVLAEPGVRAQVAELGRLRDPHRLNLTSFCQETRLKAAAGPGRAVRSGEADHP